MCAWSQGTTAAVVLGLPTSPRALAVAGAGAPLAADAWATFLAPAQLARVGGMSVAVASESYLAGTQLSSAAIVVPIGLIQVFKNMNIYDPDSTEFDPIRAAEMAMTNEKILSLGMPMYLAASGSCEIAKMALPKRVN